MKIEIFKPKFTAFGTFHDKCEATTVFVTDEDGHIHVDPLIFDTDDDVVVFERYGEEAMGTAIALATLTPAEALVVAKKLRYRVQIAGRVFEWSAPTRNRTSNWCTGFVKKRGSRTWLLPVTMDDALALVNKTKKLVYWTNSRRAEIVAA